MHPSTPFYCYSNTYHHTHHPTMRDTSIHNKRAARYVAALIILLSTARDTSAQYRACNTNREPAYIFLAVTPLLVLVGISNLIVVGVPSLNVPQ